MSRLVGRAKWKRKWRVCCKENSAVHAKLRLYLCAYPASGNDSTFGYCTLYLGWTTTSPHFLKVMFAPGSTTHNGSSARNPRRRNRTTSEDSVTTRQSSKRQKRASLTPSTFEPLSVVKSNGHVTRAKGSSAPRKVSDQRTQREGSVGTTSLALRSRGSKRGDREKQSSYGEGSVLVCSIVVADAHC